MALLHASCTMLVCAPQRDCAKLLRSPALAALLALAVVSVRLLSTQQAAQLSSPNSALRKDAETQRFWAGGAAASMGFLLCRLFALFPGRELPAGESASSAWLLLCSTCALVGVALMGLSLWIWADGPALAQKTRDATTTGAQMAPRSSAIAYRYYSLPSASLAGASCASAPSIRRCG